MGGSLVERPTERPGGSERVRIELGNEWESGSAWFGFTVERLAALSEKQVQIQSKSGGMRRTPNASRVNADWRSLWSARSSRALESATALDRSHKLRAESGGIRRTPDASRASQRADCGEAFGMCAISQSGQSRIGWVFGRASAIFGSSFANVAKLSPYGLLSLTRGLATGTVIER